MSDSCNNSSPNRATIMRSPLERKNILRRVVTNAKSLEDTINDGTIQTLETFVAETDSINSETTIIEKIRHQEEVLLDSKVMSITSRVLKGCTKSLTKSIRSYNYQEFAQKIIQHLQESSNSKTAVVDWSCLETQAIKCFKRTPYNNTLLGTLAPLQKKEIAKRKTTVKDAQAAIKKPEKVVVADKKEEGLEQTVKIMKAIIRYCKTNQKPLDFFRLILHPSDFGKTIENILHVSFLVTDGKVKLTKDESGILLIHPCGKEMSAQVKAGHYSNVQNIISLNMEQWKMLKDTYRLSDSMID